MTMMAARLLPYTANVGRIVCQHHECNVSKYKEHLQMLVICPLEISKMGILGPHVNDVICAVVVSNQNDFQCTEF